MAWTTTTPFRAPDTAIYLQDECYKHKFIRSKDTSTIVERPERLRALKMGLAAAIARLEDARDASIVSPKQKDIGEELYSALDRLTLSDGQQQQGGAHDPFAMRPVDVVAIVKPDLNLKDLALHPAVRMVHAATDDDSINDSLEHLNRLATWARESEDKIRTGDCEIPTGFPQGDLYMCPQSYSAICGAVQTVCDAVDSVATSSGGQYASQYPQPEGRVHTSSPTNRAFVAIRPPGHHCGEDTPSGFCFVNNVAIGAAHAYLQHSISRAIILDIDLHHGNGTQAIAWAINAETERKRLELEAQAAVRMLDSSYQAPSYPPDPYPPLNGTVSSATSKTPVSKLAPTPAKPGLRMFYASAHDILSYPCEDGNPELVRDASVSLPHGAHGQWIENVHLETYESEREFWIGNDAEGEGVYERTFGKLLRGAEGFIRRTQPRKTPASQQAQGREDEDDVIIFVSCGFDASEHEYLSMSRHGRRVPAPFYYRFARDVRALADKHARGRVVSVLEGGYSDRALIAGGLAWLTGLVGYGLPLDEGKPSTRNDNAEAVAVDGVAGRTGDATPRDAWMHGTGPRDWWALGNLEKMEKAIKKQTQRRGKTSLGNLDHSPWFARTIEVFGLMEGLAVPSQVSSNRRPIQPAPAPSTMTLRGQRKPPSTTVSSSSTAAGASKSENKRPASSYDSPIALALATAITPAAAGPTVVVARHPLQSAALKGVESPACKEPEQGTERGTGDHDHDDGRSRHTASGDSERQGRRMNEQELYVTQQDQGQLNTSFRAIGPTPTSGTAGRSTGAGEATTTTGRTERGLPRIILKVKPPPRQAGPGMG